MIKEFIKNKLSINTRRILRNMVDDIKAIGFGYNLDNLGKIYRTDKIGDHFYTPHYRFHLRRYKYKRINLLEIGVGGYEYPFVGGNSLRMWKKYFPFGNIFAIDIFEKSALQETRIKIFKGSQNDKEFLAKVTKEISKIDIIIDDGSHINEHVIETFNFLFPKLSDGGIYIVEDTQTSYWKEYGGDPDNLNNPSTIMNYFKTLTDALNCKEFNKPLYKQNYFDRNIISIHFYHNLIFIYKGNNND